MPGSVIVGTYGRDPHCDTLKLIAIGASTGVIIPKAMLARMNVAKGDCLYVVEASYGGYRLTAYDPAFAKRTRRPTTSCAAIAKPCTFLRSDWRGADLDRRTLHFHDA